MNHNVLTKSESCQDGNSCIEYHQVLCQKGSQEEHVIMLSPLGRGWELWAAGPWLILPQEAQHSGTFPHLTVANCWKMLWVLMENIHWMWLCVASKKDSWELQLPESHISWVTCSSHKSCEHCWNSGHHYLILTRDALYDGLFSLTDLHGSGNKKETESFLIRED